MAGEELLLVLCICAAMCVCCIGIVFVWWKKFKKDKKATPSTVSKPSVVAPATPANAGTVASNTGTTRFSRYWVAQDGQKYLLDCGSSPPKKPESVAMKGKEVVLNSGTRKYVLDGTGVKVDGYMWDACYCEGSCHVGNVTVNLEKEGRAPKFSKTVGKTWGIGMSDNKLVPFVSVTADNTYKYGTKLYVKGLEGVKLPSGEVHNGCVRVDDSCGDGCGKDHVDFHIGTYDNYVKTMNMIPDKVTVEKRPSCVIKAYTV